MLWDALSVVICPLGGGDRGQEHLANRQAQQQARQRVHGRSLVYLKGGPRQGKTTFLASWLFRSGDWPRFPAWYSLRRQSGPTASAEALRRAISEQLESAFLVVRDPRKDGDSLDSLDRLTSDRIDVVIDGLDEIEEPQQLAVLDFLAMLPGTGLTVVGTQAAPAGYEQLGANVELRSNVALHVIDGFAQEFLDGGSPALREIGLCLREPKWRNGLASHAGGNPWVLKEFLQAIKEGHWGWPDTPAEARFLTHDVRAYCKDVLDGVLDSPKAAPYAENLRALIGGLALLDDRPWPLTDALYLLGLPRAPIDLARLQQAARHLPFSVCSTCSHRANRSASETPRSGSSSALTAMRWSEGCSNGC